MPFATTPLASGPGRRRRGSPESEDLPPARHRTPRGRRIRARTLSHHRGGSCLCSRARGCRIGRNRPAPAAHRFALADRHRIALLDRRRPPGRRRRRPVRLPQARAPDEAVRNHAQRRGDRAPPSRPRRRPVRREQDRRGARQAAHPCPRPALGEHPRSGVRPDSHARGGDGTPPRGREARRADEEKDRRARSLGLEAGPAADRLPRAHARLLLGHLQDLHRAGLRPVRLEEHRRCRGQERHRVPAALGRVHPRRKSRSGRARGHALLWPEQGRCGRAAGMEPADGGPAGEDPGRRRLGRLPLGAADRGLRPGGRPRVAAGMTEAAELAAGKPGAPEEVGLRLRQSSRLWGLAAVVFFVAALVTGTLIGPVDLPATAVAESVGAHLHLGVHSHLSATEDAILWQLRLPRVVLACLVGAMLAAAGATYQGVSRNPLADPYLLGVAAGAGLGATVAIVNGSGRAAGGDLVPLAAFVGASAAVALAYALGRSAGAGQGGIAALAGVTVASFLTAVQTFVQQQHADTLQTVYSWILGRLDTAGWHDVLLLLPYAAVSAAMLLVHRRVLDVLSLGDDEAASLGVNVGRIRLVLVGAATLGTAAAVAVSGLIGFVGIIVPHAIRLVVGGSYRTLIPLSLLVGGGFLVFADVLARTVIAPGELPIGVVTAFFGAPFFAVVLRTSRLV